MMSENKKSLTKKKPINAWVIDPFLKTVHQVSLPVSSMNWHGITLTNPSKEDLLELMDFSQLKAKHPTMNVMPQWKYDSWVPGHALVFMEPFWGRLPPMPGFVLKYKRFSIPLTGKAVLMGFDTNVGLEEDATHETCTDVHLELDKLELRWMSIREYEEYIAACEVDGKAAVERLERENPGVYFIRI